MSAVAAENFSLAVFCNYDATSYDGSTNETIILHVAICSTYSMLQGVITGTNVFFLLFAGAAVFLMQSGFAMLCAGSVRQKNVKNIMLKNLLDACGGALGFYLIGYGLAYGDSDGDPTNAIRFIGNTNFALQNESDGSGYIGFFFQFAFAATAATIVAGTVAERCKMAAYLCYSLFLTAFVYPVVVHSTWASDGFLCSWSHDLFLDVGVIDFAGSGVVHLTGGATALVAAIILGPRRGRFYDEDGNALESPTEFPAHSTALQILGTFILWFGWYGFNPGSALATTDAGSADLIGLAAVTTTLSAASGCVTAMFTDTIIEMLRTGEVSYDLTMAMNGALGGLVGITAGTANVDTWAALIIGMISGWCYYGFSNLLIKLKIDDAVDAVPVHCACGIWGVLAVGFFETTHGLFYGGNGNLMVAHIVQILFILGWVSGTMIPFFIALKMAGMFRVDPLEEEVGLDISHHRGAAYDLTGAKQADVEELREVRASRHGKVEVPAEVADAAKEETA
eukprot:CAMPEP_0202441276 /NCGR_PEP_ID=MMETSP1360-20130828/717_1 /ASSEMBLY_ACC=CAM_ASM_000848 /TAXON_ID=515479 /ORGANISM="Licmophora paradoxa, Strain CCMP2313" /LENGTH=508 /DNA_ID=CAMNT_0049056159 /DNA_START=26 /DNA_END=1552 /DNA_ORIENTATION=+